MNPNSNFLKKLNNWEYELRNMQQFPSKDLVLQHGR